MTTVVIGGGISGLSAAYYLSKKQISPITVIEASHRVGGWIKSNILANGVLFEEGPRTLRPQGEAALNTLQLIEELGLSHQLVPILSNNPAARNRMIFANNKLHSLPSSFSGLFVKQSPFSKSIIRHFLKDFNAPKSTAKDESVYEFANRRFGNEVADYLISPLICGICAGNSKEISVNFLMKRLFEYEQQYGSIYKGILQNIFNNQNINLVENNLSARVKKERWSIYSFRNGMETLPKALEGYLTKNKVNLQVNMACKHLECIDNGVDIKLEDGSSILAKHVISSLPASKLSMLLEKQHPVLSDYLSKIKSVNVAVVNLHFNNNVIVKPGFGFLVPPKENLSILGVIYDSCCFPRQNGSILTVMMGGYWFREKFGDSPTNDMLLKTAVEHLRQILDVKEEPEHYKVNVLRDCIPQYTVGHNENLEKINNYISENKLPLSICGASYYGVGVNDVILSAKNIVDKI